MDELLLNTTALALLDTPAEERFDRLTRLATLVAGCPFALLTVLTPQRQWFKSAQGTTITQTPLEISFCLHTLRKGSTLILENLHDSQEFCNNPVVCGDPNLKFYAGVPLRSPQGEFVGTLCSMDSVARSITPEQVRGLEDLAKVAEAEIASTQWSDSERSLLEQIASPARFTLLDDATRCWNQQAILHLACAEMERCREHRRPLSLLLLQTSIGDDAEARQRAEILRRRLASYQTLGRLDTEVFLVLLPERTTQEVQGLAQQLSQDVSGRYLLRSGEVKPQAPEELLTTLQEALEQVCDVCEQGTELILKTLGPFQFEKSGQVVPHSAFRTQKNRLLLAFLAGCHNRQSHVDLLVEEFWPTGGDGARASLRGALSVVRQMLRTPNETTDPLERNGNFVQLVGERQLWSDSDAFARLAESGREEELRQALDLYQGSYLEGDYEDWVLRRRDKLIEIFLSVCLKLSRQSFARGDFEAAAQISERALQVAPERQDINAVLFRSWLRQGLSERVIKGFRILEKRLRDDYEVEPSLELFELFHRAELGLSS